MDSKNKEERKPIKSLRTFQGDVDEIMSKSDVSATTIFVAEQKRKEEKPDILVESGKNEARNKSIILLGSLFMILGVLAVSAVYFINSRQQAEVVRETKAIIAFSLEKEIQADNLNRAELISTISSESAGFSLPLNSVLFLNLTEGTLSNKLQTEKLLKVLTPTIPSSLSRSFGDEYMIGVLSYDTNEPFIILKTEDYALSYSGMLKWEKDMVGDLGSIFKINTSQLGTTTAFVDQELRNKDLRILRNPNGQSEILYSFIDRNTLVITKNETIFNAILAKYLTNQTTR